VFLILISGLRPILTRPRTFEASEAMMESIEEKLLLLFLDTTGFSKIKSSCGIGNSAEIALKLYEEKALGYISQ